MATIIQEYGPIYGEVVNGTVAGRPNGSVYVPLSNKIELLDNGYVATPTGTFQTHAFRIGSKMGFAADSQDLANYVQRQVYSDSDCTTLIAYTNGSAGQFNAPTVNNWARVVSDDVEAAIEDGTYYYRVQLMAANGSPVATSEVAEITVTVVT